MALSKVVPEKANFQARPCIHYTGFNVLLWLAYVRNVVLKPRTVYSSEPSCDMNGFYLCYLLVVVVAYTAPLTTDLPEAEKSESQSKKGLETSN